jgi:hypothetical protein
MFWQLDAHGAKRMAHGALSIVNNLGRLNGHSSAVSVTPTGLLCVERCALSIVPEADAQGALRIPQFETSSDCQLMTAYCQLQPAIPLAWWQRGFSLLS